jgi:hypothetical protein
MIQPQRIGRFLKTDEKGFIIPDVSLEQVSPDYLPVLNFVSRALMDSGKVRSVYLRGSVPRGLAIPFLSDADFMYLSDESLDDLELTITEQVKEQFPFLKGLELSRESTEEFHRVYFPQQTRPYVQMLLKTQSLFLAGEDVVSDLAPFRPDVEMISHVFNLQKEFLSLPKRFEKYSDAENRARITRWFCRRVVRAGLEITLPHFHRYTRDLYLCYEQFSELFPDRREQMYLVLENALNGNRDPLKEESLIRFLSEHAPSA